jgi:hypothetical protein
MPEEITAQYPSESMRRSAKRMRSRGVIFFFPSPSVSPDSSPPPLPSLPEADFESPSSSLPPSRPPTRRRTSRAGLRRVKTARRCVQKGRTSPRVSCAARRRCRPRRLSLREHARPEARGALGMRATRATCEPPVDGDTRRASAVAGVTVTAPIASVGACADGQTDRDSKIGTSRPGALALRAVLRRNGADDWKRARSDARERYAKAGAFCGQGSPVRVARVPLPALVTRDVSTER